MAALYFYVTCAPRTAQSAISDLGKWKKFVCKVKKPMSSSEEELEIGSSDSEDAVVQDPDDFEALPKSKLRAQQPLDVTYDPAYQGTDMLCGHFLSLY